MTEELKVIISAEVGKLKQGVEEAKGKVNGFKSEVEKAKGKVSDNFSKMGTAINKGLKIGIGAIAGAATALIALSASTAEYREAQAKLTTAFETAGGSAEAAKETYNDLYRVLGDTGQATEAAAHIAKLTTEEQALSEWTTICQGVYATFGDSLPIEGLTEAVNHSAKLGETQGVLADALEWSGISVDTFNEKLQACNSESEREKLIRETLNGLYNEAAANYEETNAQVLAQNEAHAKMSESMAQVGAAIAPVITLLTELAANALAAVAPYLQSFADNHLPAIKEALTTVSEKLQEVFTWVSEHTALLGTIAGIITGIVTAIGLYNAVAAIKAAMTAAEVTTIWGLVAAYAAQAAAMIVAIAPYLLIVAAIAAVIAIIVLCVKHWDEIQAKVKEVWENIKLWVTEAVENVKTTITGWVANIKAKFEEIKTNITNALSAAKAVVVSIFEAITSNITTKINTAKSVISGVVTAICAIFTGDFGAAKTAVLGIFDSIKSGIETRINNAKNVVNTAIETIKGFFNFSWSLPTIKLPHFSISGKFSLNPPSIPKFSVSWYQMGGVFDNTTLFPYGNGSIGGLGENGAEAVVPLEKNTYWLTRLADMLSERMGGGTPIVLQVDGKTFAQTAVESMNSLTRQTGKLDLIIV